MAEAVHGITRVLNRFLRMQQRAANPGPALKAAGVYMLGSIDRNFKEGGRPEKWTALAASTLAGRKRGKGKGGVKILVDEGRLKTMTVNQEGDRISIGPNVIYGRRQHWGYPGGKPGRGHSPTPARPFLMFQAEDVSAIAGIFNRYVIGR